MFDEIGTRIKMYASVIFWIAVAASIIIGIVLISMGVKESHGGGGLIAEGFFTLLFGWFPSYIGSLIVYGFGELIEKTTEIAKNSASSAATKRAVEVTDDMWKCPACGKYHKNYVGTCGCGMRKP
ncbi:MAG: hypothetical protein J1F17_02495 [Oscillospiraceae bacterium]|nr:hypothetical protein [Oscillospiraceae bacterium]